MISHNLHSKKVLTIWKNLNFSKSRLLGNGRSAGRSAAAGDRENVFGTFWITIAKIDFIQTCIF